MDIKKTQQEIHKVDMLGEERSPVAYLDILLSDLQEQVEKIANAKGFEHDTRISMLAEYIRGCRDGNRFMKQNPFK